jgi:hypothetical protein
MRRFDELATMVREAVAYGPCYLVGQARQRAQLYTSTWLPDRPFEPVHRGAFDWVTIRVAEQMGLVETGDVIERGDLPADLADAIRLFEPDQRYGWAYPISPKPVSAKEKEGDDA